MDNEFTKLLEKVNNFMFMDNINKSASNEKVLETLTQTIRIYSQA